MDNSIIKDGDVREFGSDIVLNSDTPSEKKIKMVAKICEDIIVWSEDEWSGEQHILTNDIIDEIRRTPSVLKQYIKSIVLYPFDHQYTDIYMNTEDIERGDSLFASLCEIPGYIIIYKRIESRDVLIKHIQIKGTIRHEAAHIMDAKLGSEKPFLSCEKEWIKAMDYDCQITFPKLYLPFYYVSYDVMKKQFRKNMEESERYVYAQREDFAESVVFFFADDWRTDYLRDNCPNRYNVLTRYFQ